MRGNHGHVASLRYESLGVGIEHVVGCSFLGPIAFLITLLTAHLFRSKPTNLFLDICCISQESAAAKATGISSVGAILDRSHRMVALVSADYFSRLWCGA